MNRKTRYAIFLVSPLPSPIRTSFRLCGSAPLSHLPAGGRPHRISPTTGIPLPLTNTRHIPPRRSLSRIAAPLHPLGSHPSVVASPSSHRPPCQPRKSLPHPPPIAPSPLRIAATPGGLPTRAATIRAVGFGGVDQSRFVAVEMGVGLVRRLTTGPCDSAAVQGCCSGRAGGEKMGVYLSTPKTDKLSADGENSRVRFGLSSMQGWRTTMEDAVSCFRLPRGFRLGGNGIAPDCSVPCSHDWFGVI